MRSPFLAAAAQLTATADVEGNLETCRKLAGDAALRGVSLLVLPENFAFLGKDPGEQQKIAETLDPDRPGPILRTLIDIARAGRFTVIAGGFPEWPSERASGAPPHNTCAVVLPSGELLPSYRKIHMFDIEIPGRVSFRESQTTSPGENAVVVDTPVGRVGLSVCYDLRFPELYRYMALKKGADILVVPAAFTAHTGAAHWHTLLRARAIENQCFVIAAGQTGWHHDKRESYGHSIIYDPWGDVLAEKESGIGLAVAEIDPARLSAVREQMPCHRHARFTGADR
jgi:predicted amidohydrolase